MYICCPISNTFYVYGLDILSSCACKQCLVTLHGKYIFWLHSTSPTYLAHGITHPIHVTHSIATCNNSIALVSRLGASTQIQYYSGGVYTSCIWFEFSLLWDNQTCVTLSGWITIHFILNTGKVYTCYI